MYIFPDDEATANLYYLMQQRPPRFWVFTYPWYMEDRIKERILLTLRDDPPEWVVYHPGRWEVERTAPEIVRYLQQHYQEEAELGWAGGTALLLRRLP
jgi:hypothetical protein